MDAPPESTGVLSAVSTTPLPEDTVVFEVGWEVARKVGGIYTVLRTKAPVSVQTYGDRYYLIGPYAPGVTTLEFEELEAEGVCRAAVLALRSSGIGVHFGRWLVQGNPRVVLFELPSAERYLDAWRWEMHERHGVSVPPEDRESNDAILFGFLVAWFLQEIRSDQMMLPMVAHCHEWLAGVALPLLRARQGLDIATVFTTHATLLGRYLCAGSSDFYNSMRTVDAEAEARRLWILHRHLLERAAAHSAHVFTTVSRITAEEATHLLKREPDLVLPNGLQIERLPVLHEFQNLHKVYKDKIHHFVRAHFIGMNDELMDYDNTLYVFTGGRYEYQNKGFDMFLESLHELNVRLKAEKINKTVVAFIITPSQTAGYNVETLARQSMARNIEDTCAQIQEGVGKRLLDAVMHGRVPTWDDLMLKEDEVTLKRRMLVMKSMLLPPPIVTHNMKDDASDPILNHLRRRQLFNRPDDRVKVVFHPEFVTSTSLFQIDYDQFVRGCHLGVFVSYYEPWGYTPAECVVRGVPAVTSNLTGFANFMEQQVPDCARRGVYVVDRRFKSPQESIEQLTTIMLNYCKLSQRHRVELRNATERLSELLDWDCLGKCYVQARELAMERLNAPEES